MNKFIIIGMDDNREPYFPPEALAHIRRGKVFSGGVRHKDIVKGLLPEGAEWISITVPLDNVFRQYEKVFAEKKEEHGGDSRIIKEDGNSIIVFASGDPLFFGFANTVRRRLPQAEIKLYPAFNSLQTLAHRLVMPYDDMRTVSLTGRPWQELDRALIEHAPKIGILTDREHTPATIAARLLEYGYTYYIMYIGEHLGNPDRERIRRMTLQEAAEGEFEHPNCLLVHADDALLAIAGSPSLPSREARPYYRGQSVLTITGSPSLPSRSVAGNMSCRPFGIPDEHFAHLPGRPGMITKAPIRLLTLQALELNRRRVLWDIGFCTGSISIEARLHFPHLTVVAFEIRPEGEELMRTNARHFGAPGITAITGDFLLTEIAHLPRPDAVFIGGHGGHLPDVLARIREVLLPGGCIVFNSVSAESKEAFCRGIEAIGMMPLPPMRIALNDYNPIEIMKATLSLT